MAFAVDAAVSRRRGGKMRIAAFMTAHAVATRTLARLERRAVHPREAGTLPGQSRPCAVASTRTPPRSPGPAAGPQLVVPTGEGA